MRTSLNILAKSDPNKGCPCGVLIFLSNAVIRLVICIWWREMIVL